MANKVFRKGTDEIVDLTGQKTVDQINAQHGNGWSEIDTHMSQSEINKIAILTRLRVIDREIGPRTLREAVLSLGGKGFNNKIEVLENEAATLRAQL